MTDPLMPSNSLPASIREDGVLLRTLMRLGYLAAWHQMSSEALIIFDGVRALRKSSEIPEIGAAVVAMIAGNPDLAIRVLKEEALLKNPASDFAKAHLGCALRMAGSDLEGRAMLEEIASTAEDPEARAAARNLLEMDYTELRPKKGIL